MGNSYGLLIEEVCSILVGTEFEVIDALIALDRPTNEAQQIEDTILDGIVQRCPMCERWIWDHPRDWNKYKGCCTHCADSVD